MINPATGWFEMQQIDSKTVAEVADISEKTRFTRYPFPQRITLDRGGTEFMAEIAKIVKDDRIEPGIHRFEQLKHLKRLSLRTPCCELGYIGDHLDPEAVSLN